MVIATSPFPSDLPEVTVVGSPADGRVAAFQAALATRGLRRAAVLDYTALERANRRAGLVRFESPSRAQRVRAALYRFGGAPYAAEGGSPLLGRSLEAALSDVGRIGCPRQFQLGLMEAMSRVVADRFMNHPDEIALAFDKPRCQALLDARGIPVPFQLGIVRSYDDLRDRMTAHRMSRVFIKLRHGSAASGIVAFEVQADREHAWTTAELTERSGQPVLYNTRAIRRHRQRSAIGPLVDALCKHEVYVEQWVPKASLGEATCDLRVVLTAGAPTHWVLRAARCPFTNLHLGGERYDAAVLRSRMSSTSWLNLVQTCRAVGRAFPRSLYLGLDVAVTRDLRRHAVLEVNAFGDHVKGVLAGGKTPHEFQVEALCL